MLLAAAAFIGFLSVVFGAYADHALAERLTADEFGSVMTALRYHQLHAVAALSVSLALWSRPTGASAGLLRAGGWGFLAGVVLFSGGIYAARLSGVDSLTILAPFGGLTLMASWLALLGAGLVAGRSNSSP